MNRKIENIKECTCSETIIRQLVSKTIPLAGRNVLVENVPASICEKCGEIYLDGPTLLKIEAKLLKESVVV